MRVFAFREPPARFKILRKVLRLLHRSKNRLCPPPVDRQALDSGNPSFLPLLPSSKNSFSADRVRFFSDLEKYESLYFASVCNGHPEQVIQLHK